MILGNLDLETQPFQPRPQTVPSLANVKDVSFGTVHALFVTTSGLVYTSGSRGLSGNEGLLGTGSASSSTVPVQISGLTNVVAVAAASDHNLVLKGDGTVWSLERTMSDSLAITPSSLEPLLFRSGNPPRPSSRTLLRSAAGTGVSSPSRDGTLWSLWAIQENARRPRSWNRRQLPGCDTLHIDQRRSIPVSWRQPHTLVVRRDGTVWAAGSNAKGELGSNYDSNPAVTYFVPTNTLTNVVSVAAGVSHS